jgi:hypothetical protein
MDGKGDERVGPGSALRGNDAERRKPQGHQSRKDNDYDAHRVLRCILAELA